MLLYDGERDDTPTPIDSLDYRGTDRQSRTEPAPAILLNPPSIPLSMR